MSDLASLPYVVLDVFAERPFTGKSAGDVFAAIRDGEWTRPKILRRDTSFYLLGWTPGTGYDVSSARSPTTG